MRLSVLALVVVVCLIGVSSAFYANSRRNTGLSQDKMDQMMKWMKNSGSRNGDDNGDDNNTDGNGDDDDDNEDDDGDDDDDDDNDDGDGHDSTSQRGGNRDKNKGKNRNTGNRNGNSKGKNGGNRGKNGGNRGKNGGNRGKNGSKGQTNNGNDGKNNGNKGSKGKNNGNRGKNNGNKDKNNGNNRNNNGNKGKNDNGNKGRNGNGNKGNTNNGNKGNGNNNGNRNTNVPVTTAAAAATTTTTIPTTTTESLKDYCRTVAAEDTCELYTDNQCLGLTQGVCDLAAPALGFCQNSVDTEHEFDQQGRQYIQQVRACQKEKLLHAVGTMDCSMLDMLVLNGLNRLPGCLQQDSFCEVVKNDKNCQALFHIYGVARDEPLSVEMFNFFQKLITTCPKDVQDIFNENFAVKFANLLGITMEPTTTTPTTTTTPIPTTMMMMMRGGRGD